jgi:DNA-binding transcriptional LysR family regulator
MFWDDLRVFLTVHRQGSHKRASRILGVDPTTVSRRITALERALGTKLFARTPERLQATASGLKLVSHAEKMETVALEAQRDVEAADARLEGSVRITATDGLVHYVLLPALAELRQEHPSLSVDLRVDNRVFDLSRREADVAVRLIRPKEPALFARRLGEIRWSLFASAGYIARRGTPRNLSALAAHDFIGFDESLDETPQNRWLRQAVAHPRYVLRATTTTAQVVACAEGHGIALLPLFITSRESRLERLLPRLMGPSRDVYAVTHAATRSNARVAASVGWLARVLAATPG